MFLIGHKVVISSIVRSSSLFQQHCLDPWRAPQVLTVLSILLLFCSRQSIKLTCCFTDTSKVSRNAQWTISHSTIACSTVLSKSCSTVWASTISLTQKYRIYEFYFLLTPHKSPLLANFDICEAYSITTVGKDLLTLILCHPRQISLSVCFCFYCFLSRGKFQTSNSYGVPR